MSPTPKMSKTRTDGRQPSDLRPVKITPGFLPAAEGSALIEIGHTKVVCSASLDEGVPSWMRGGGKGWITAEYGMLPRATSTRTAREVNRGRPGGRTHEIQRLIGRALRSVIRLDKLGERTIYIDCDVLQADGGTRTASITGAWVALALALKQMVDFRMISEMPLRASLAAVSVGMVDGVAMLDLCYEEDSRAQVDMNVVMTASGEFAEVQSTGESSTFTLDQLQQMLTLAQSGIAKLFEVQKEIISL
jgi:ribonuclease PH